MPKPALTPEQKARVLIDAMLEAAGWVVQSVEELDLTAARGVAVREFPTAPGPVDYLLYVDRKAIGTIEAKKAGETLRDVESQSRPVRRGLRGDGARRRASRPGARRCRSTT